jgi:2-polyprenyl-3-methyl-5-hydroxy-6-metoxy-1,4-benzoquinol methylase
MPSAQRICALGLVGLLGLFLLLARLLRPTGEGYSMGYPGVCPPKAPCSPLQCKADLGGVVDLRSKAVIQAERVALITELRELRAEVEQNALKKRKSQAGHGRCEGTHVVAVDNSKVTEKNVDRCLHAGEDAAHHTATVEPGGTYRKFKVYACGSVELTLADLYPVFASHALEWNILGRDNAWWSVVTDDRYRTSDDLPTELKNEFYSSGLTHVEMVHKDLVTTFGGEGLNVPDVLDFGCGLGRQAFSMAKHAEHVACVEASVHHLIKAEAEWTRLHPPTSDALYPRMKFVLSTPDMLAALRGSKFDIVHSVIVMQHMLPPLQQVYLEQLCDVLKPGGHGWIQIP